MKKSKKMKKKAKQTKQTKWGLVGLVFVLIFVMFSGFGLFKLYNGLKVPATVVVDPTNPGDSSTNEPDPVEDPLQLYQVKVEELQKQILKTEASLQTLLSELSLTISTPETEEMELELFTDLTLNWQKQSGSIKVANAQALGELKTALTTAAENGGSQLLRTEEVQSTGAKTEALYFGFVEDGKEVVTHKYSLTHDLVKVKPKAKLAFVIDDLGYEWPEFERMMTIPRPMTFAVIPNLPRSVQQAKRAWQEGYDLILHQPMEPTTKANPGPGAIYTHMSEDEILRILSANLASLPQGLIGANNHMGSKATADERVMRIVLEFFRERGMFFIDSSTAPDSVVAKMAVQAGQRYAENNIFLDNVDELEKTKEQVMKAGRLALREGEAIAIGHVRKYTARAILESIDELEAMGVQIVHAKDLLKHPTVRPVTE